jgi:Flp pilus assembly protein TadG
MRMLLQKAKQRSNDETGAELVEFAFVIVLLITILYGIITYGMILAAQSTLTQAAADAARSGLVAGLTNAPAVAQAQAQSDVSWMDKGTCGTSGTIITCNAVPEPCPSNTSMSATTQCLKVTIIYNYSQSPLFPELPGLGLITPSTITSTNIIQLGTVS